MGTVSYWAYGLLILGILTNLIRSDDPSESTFEQSIGDQKPPSLIVVTVATDQTDGFLRLQRSAEQFDLKLNVFGLGQQWNGGDTRYYQGGGQKIKILRESLKEYKDRKDVIVLFVDAYDVVFNAGEEEILAKFDEIYYKYRVVFSAEPFCWPRKELAPEYPTVQFGKRFLNSGLFMGYAPEIWRIINEYPVADEDDDQLYYTNIYLDEKLRNDLKITLDSMSFIFQNLNGIKDDVAIEFNDNGDAQISNVPYNTHPLIVHGNGPSKIFLNYLGNYIGNSWSQHDGCLFCKTTRTDEPLDLLDRSIEKEEGWPTVLLAIMIVKPIPFVREFLDAIKNLNYPLSKIDLYIYNNQKYNEKDVNDFISGMKTRCNSIHLDNLLTDLGEREARSFTLEYATQVKTDYMLMIDADVHLVNADTLRILVETAYNLKIGILSPLVVQQDKFFSNFWGAISENGYYARSHDYIEIVKQERTGIWNVPFINSVYLIANWKFDHLKEAYSANPKLDPDMAFCDFARSSGHFMYVDNRQYFGFLVISDDFDATKLHPEMYQIFDNRYLWESRYIPKEYFDVLEPEAPVNQPCQDVYDFPLMSEMFCKELIEEMENFGEWSSGKNQDGRLAGGYENVPTRDIHMKQIDFERHWLYFMDEYVRPMQEKLFIGYYQQPVQSSMMFVVRYRPDEQASLRPHQDASTYSIDVALNRRGVDYQGGGVRYIRYNCTVDADRVGYSMLFPGRLTHLHEGLPTTEGTRYIAVSFLNP